METTAIKKIKSLVKLLNEANYQYYNLSNPKINDQQYDALLKELIILETNYPQHRLPYSPTLKIGGFVEKKFKNYHHTIPMMSLDNAFNIEELKNFYDRIVKINPSFSLLTELKIDGVAINLKYKKGILTQALTRGNGILGEDITKNVQTIKTVPLKLSQPIDIEVRGEIYLSYPAFEKLNQKQKENNKTPFANPRNAASGTLRQLNSKIVAQRNLSIFIYNITSPYLIKPTQLASLEFLIQLGFTVNPHYNLALTFEDLLVKIQNYKVIKDTQPYDTDGVVIKVNELALHALIGATSKAPKWAIAYKFPAKTSQSIVTDIIFQLGRTGMITPICQIMPVLVDGSLISKVVLHNYDFISKKDIRIGDCVTVHKAGSVIPEILEVVASKRTNQKKTMMILQCPYCKSNLVKKEGKVDYFCLNDDCYWQKIQRLIHFVSKKAMDINVLGEKTIITLFNQHLIQKPSDLYLLHTHLNILQTLPSFGQKKINNILKAIEQSKTKPLERVLFGLGIKHVGEKISQVLVKNNLSLEKLATIKLEALTAIPEIGDKIAKSINIFFNNPRNIAEIQKLQQLGVSFQNTINQTVVKKTFFSDKKIVLTGTLQNYTRLELTQILKQMGANISSSLSAKTDFLIAGTNAGSKLTKAQKLKISIIEEAQLEKWIKQTD
ncbi:NAD-dependent DNA ligase LigA [Candidatus Phytoplasma solani]|uniref:NAD-dependent DNA ligase LigA n=1 Tax=Candidatus Phytoplasma solani TaxID=69896 RepID=UPI00358FD800